MFAGMEPTSLQRVETVCKAKFHFWLHHISDSELQTSNIPSSILYIKQTFRMAFPFQGSKYKECTYVNEIGVSTIISIS
jgi:hypothetical protein